MEERNKTVTASKQNCYVKIERQFYKYRYYKEIDELSTQKKDSNKTVTRKRTFPH